MKECNMMNRILIGFMFVLGLTATSLANDIYVTQSGATLDLDITQDGQNNTVGNSTTASASTGAAFNMDIDQIGSSNVIKYQVNGCLLYTSPSPRDKRQSRMPSSA